MEGWYHNSSVMVRLRSILGTGSIITYLSCKFQYQLELKNLKLHTEDRTLFLSDSDKATWSDYQFNNNFYSIAPILIKKKIIFDQTIRI